MALAKYAEDNLEFNYERMAAAEYRRKEPERPEKEKNADIHTAFENKKEIYNKN